MEVREQETQAPGEIVAPPAAEPKSERVYPGVCTRCGGRIARAEIFAERRHNRPSHWMPETDSRGLETGRKYACGPVHTTWYYFVSCAWEHEGRIGFDSHQINLKVPIDNGVEVREIEGLLAQHVMGDRHLTAPPRVTVIGYELLKAQ
jgi:hypothetical protein